MSFVSPYQLAKINGLNSEAYGFTRSFASRSSVSTKQNQSERIPNKIWTDEDGVEHVKVNFYIRGPHGAGKVYSEMFKDSVDKQWKFMSLIVKVKSPTPAQLMLESYVPA